MLSDIDLLFEHQHIDYFICYGTFLGAVRHQGVIPWDDDIDFGICSKDEAKLKALEPELNELGYSICEWSFASNRDSPVFYKVWISSILPQAAYPFAWPFIDIFVFRPNEAGDAYSDGQLEFKNADLLPLKRYLFAGFKVPGPASLKSLEAEYGPHFADICISSSYNHRFELPREAPISASLKFIQAHGYDVKVHLEDKFGLEKRPTQVDTIRLKTRNGLIELECSDGRRHTLNSALYLIWQWANGAHTIEQMIYSICHHYQRPMIEAATDVINALRVLHNNGLIRVE